MEINEVQISERLVSMGDSVFLRECVIPIALELERPNCEDPDWVEECLSDLDGMSRPQADAGSLTAVVTFLAYLGTWAAYKTLDELYDSKIRPLVREKFIAFSEKHKLIGKYALSIAIFTEETRTAAIIAAIGRTAEEVENSEALLPAAIASAAAFVSAQAQPSKVYLYTVEAGTISPSPLPFDSLAEAIGALRGRQPIRLPNYVAKHS